MAEYRFPIDIANRACDHCGVPRIASFTDDAKAAASIGAIYDQLRTAELRRNVWRFSIRKVALRAVNTSIDPTTLATGQTDLPTMVLVPPAWVSTATYPQGSIVSYNNTLYFADQYVPLNITPGTPNEAYWTVYFGPMTASPWVPGSATTYYAGELVYNVVNGVVNVYQCLLSGTLDDPTAAPIAWSATTTYNVGDTVTYSSATWQSKVDLNTNNAPAVGAYWQVTPVVNQAATQVGQGWLQINAAVRYQRFQYPIGAGPSNQNSTRNIFQLPSGFLRRAPQDPKAGATSYLGAPSGLPQDDWEFESGYITSMDQQVIILRFVADIQDVSMMDPMFCEGLGARIGLEVCEPLTQSDAKLNTISQMYKTFMGEARAVNGIETGSVEPPLDDYISCRI